MFDGILAAVRSVAEQFMLDDVTIKNRIAADFDDENPFGDDIVEYETVTETVKGWLVNPATKSVTQDGGMSIVVDDPTLRLPVGTFVNRGSVITVNGEEYKVIGDASDDETWDAMLKVRIARVE